MLLTAREQQQRKGRDVMAWQIVKQPNGMYARFCEIASDFTVYGMTREDAVLLCREAGLGETEAEQNVRWAERSPKRYAEAMQTIATAHGADLRKDRERELQ
jgi:hypothetical protein